MFMLFFQHTDIRSVEEHCTSNINYSVYRLISQTFIYKFLNKSFTWFTLKLKLTQKVFGRYIIFDCSSTAAAGVYNLFIHSKIEWSFKFVGTNVRGLLEYCIYMYVE